MPSDNNTQAGSILKSILKLSHNTQISIPLPAFILVIIFIVGAVGYVYELKNSVNQQAQAIERQAKVIERQE